MKISGYYPATIKLDNPETGATEEVRIRVKRFTLEQSSQFMRDYYKSANPASAALLARKPDGAEQEKVGEAFVVDDETVRRRRLVEMTEDERAEYDSMDEEESRFADKFLSDAIRNYVTVEADQLFEDGPDGEQRQITAGADLLRVFGGRADVLSQLLRAVHYENCLSAAAKKALRLVSDSARSSVEHAKEAAGLSREPTAAAAGTSASAGTAGATGEATSPSSSSSDGAAPATEAS